MIYRTEQNRTEQNRTEQNRTEQNRIVIIGSSGHAKVVIDIVEQQGRYRIAGLLDLYRTVGEQTLGYQVLGQEEDLPQLTKIHSIQGCIVAIGDNFIRSKVATRVKEISPHMPFVSAIHPKASLAKDVSIGEGTVIMAGVSVNPCCSIGRLCILNTNSSLDHDSIMEDFSSLAPRATTGGNCRIGGYSAISIGGVLIHGVHIGEHTVVGAGSTVLKHIKSFSVAYGTPAKTIRERKSGDKYL
jgi:sugar O-acyltransferase (sialic acid O-acetyltransferase NeuD family)